VALVGGAFRVLISDGQYLVSRVTCPQLETTISKLHNMLVGTLCYVLVIATTLEAGRSGFRISVRGNKFLSSPKHSDRL
jgi:hypothetical protein